MFLFGALVLYNMRHEGSSLGPSRAWGGGLHGIYHFLSRAWRGGFMVFLFGVLCYTICIMKAPPQALEGPGEEPSWHFHGI